jgi:Protein of unknown function (DUF2950)
MKMMKIASVCGVLYTSSLVLALTAAAQQPAPKPQTSPRTFDTAQQAADAFIAAAEKFDVAALEAIVGPTGRNLVVTEDAVADKSRAQEFAAKARERKTVTPDPTNRNLAILSVGNDDWPLPLPIVRKGGKWLFDTAAGQQEILNRIIGANELDAIVVCRGFVEAQHEFALTKREVSGVNQYAQRIISTPGKQDGLAWRNPDGSWDGPIGEAIARAIEQGYSERSEPYHGYYFKVLKGQGPAAPLGEIDFVVKGVMIGGFALVAAPAQYGVTGIQTFMVSHDGVVYEKDFGADTLNVFKKMERFNPDKTWNPVEER